MENCRNSISYSTKKNMFAIRGKSEPSDPTTGPVDISGSRVSFFKNEKSLNGSFDAYDTKQTYLKTACGDMNPSLLNRYLSRPLKGKSYRRDERN